MNDIDVCPLSFMAQLEWMMLSEKTRRGFYDWLDLTNMALTRIEKKVDRLSDNANSAIWLSGMLLKTCSLADDPVTLACAYVAQTAKDMGISPNLE